MVKEKNMIPTAIIIHHSATSPTVSLDQINAWHEAKFGVVSSLGGYIGYHYVIDFSGQLFQTRRDNEIGAHCPPNDGKIGICVLGDFSVAKPSEPQLTTLSTLVEQLKKDYNIKEVKGHRDFRPTECPGDSLYNIVVVDHAHWLTKIISIIKKVFQPHV